MPCETVPRYDLFLYEPVLTLLPVGRFFNASMAGRFIHQWRNLSLAALFQQYYPAYTIWYPAMRTDRMNYYLEFRKSTTSAT